MGLFGSFFGHTRSTIASAATPLDLVNQAAGLVSNPREVDPILDRMRAVTSRLHPGETLSESDEAALLGVYLSVEEYLVTKEPLRTFSREELRAHMALPLRTRLEAYQANYKNKES